MFQCIHKNTKYICKICNDKNNKYCKHGKLKWLCIICENQPCIHKIIKKIVKNVEVRLYVNI